MIVHAPLDIIAETIRRGLLSYPRQYGGEYTDGVYVSDWSGKGLIDKWREGSYRITDNVSEELNKIDSSYDRLDIFSELSKVPIVGKAVIGEDKSGAFHTCYSKWRAFDLGLIRSLSGRESAVSYVFSRLCDVEVWYCDKNHRKETNDKIWGDLATLDSSLGSRPRIY